MTIFEPNARQSVEEVAVFDDRVVASLYDNVRGRAAVFTDKGEFGGWTETALPVAGEFRDPPWLVQPGRRPALLYL